MISQSANLSTDIGPGGPSGTRCLSSSQSNAQTTMSSTLELVDQVDEHGVLLANVSRRMSRLSGVSVTKDRGDIKVRAGAPLMMPCPVQHAATFFACAGGANEGLLQKRAP